MTRITDKDLERLVLLINKANYTPEKPYDDQGKAAIGNYHLDSAYGGVKLVRMVNAGGGIREISTGGYGTKRELFCWMDAYLTGHKDGSIQH